MCLSTSSKTVAWGRDPCQYARNEAGCKVILKYAGCLVVKENKPGDSHSVVFIYSSCFSNSNGLFDYS